MLLYTDNDSLTNPHGPYDGGSHFLYLYGKMGPEGDYTNETGRVFSPMYTQSAAECTLDLFYYINGNTGEWTDQDGVHQSSLGTQYAVEFFNQTKNNMRFVDLSG